MRSHKLSYGAVSLLLSCLPALAKQYDASHYDVSLAVSPGGTLHVTESVDFRFGHGPFTFVYRNLATTETDGIGEIKAWLDGVECPMGGAPGQVEVRGSSPVRVTWHFNPVQDATHSFTVSYQVTGAIRRLDGVDALVWRALPPDREYRIASSRIKLEYPKQLDLLRAPSVRKADDAFALSPGLATIELHDVKSGFPAIVTAEFPLGSLVSKEPDWQAAGEQHGRDFRAGLRDGAFGAIGLAIVALLAILWARREQPQRADPPSMPISQPPDDLKPTLAAVLAGSHRGMGALLLELVRRGVLQVEEIKHSRWTSRDYQVELCGKPSGLAPHERSFLELLFKDGARSTRLSESAARVSGGWPKIAAAIKHELRQAGLIDEERSRTRRGLMAASGMGLLLGFALFVAGMVLSKENEAARLAGVLVALGIGAMAIAFIVLILAASLSRLTDRGEALKVQWRSFARYLKEGGAGIGTTEFERFLPYAAAFGLAGAWTKRYQGAGGTLPSWFAPLGGDDGGVAFLTFVTASDSGGTSDGGAGSAGASGGGGSGAG